MKITIRKARRKDWLILAKLHREFRFFHFKIIDKISRKFRIFESHYSQREFYNILRKRNSRYLVALAGQQIIGFAIAKIEKNRYYKRKVSEGIITELYITKDYRGQGVAQKLKKVMYDWFDEKDVEFIELAVYSDNRKAIDVYKNWGFKPFVVLMEKEF
jgi:ribosomal protein S18 acetylase RimI-like enzyme